MREDCALFLPDEAFDAENTLFCGQSFAWRRVECRGGRGYVAAIGHNAAFIAPEPGGHRLVWRGEAATAWWRRYFDLDYSYDGAALVFNGDETVRRAFSACCGLRVLNQPIWETLCAFIISANNNDARIRLCVARLAEALGSPLTVCGHTVWRFPAPEEIAAAGADTLRGLGLGYRAPYLCDTAAKIAGDAAALDALPEMGYEDAAKWLTGLMGVGPKVADCVLLFSCGYRQAFPVDVWVERTMQKLYGPFPGGKKETGRFGRDRFGEHAGVVQQMLFHAARTGRLPLPAD